MNLLDKFWKLFYFDLNPSYKARNSFLNAILLDPLSFFDPFERTISDNLKDRIMTKEEAKLLLSRVAPYQYWSIGKVTRCEYCGNTETMRNVRDGLECSGCGHPR